MKTCISLLFALSLTPFLNAQTIIGFSEVSKTQKNGVEIVVYQNTPYTGITTETYENGKPKSWISYKEGLADGSWQEWYENGKLKFNSTWKKGKGHGLWEYFHENGTLRQEEFYAMDIPTGVFRDFYNNGQLKVQASWLGGMKEGRWTYYSEDGMLRKTEIYRDGKLIQILE
jgi:antitoxin component YwqK of YwqJK toxin-antitoxin module